MATRLRGSVRQEAFDSKAAALMIDRCFKDTLDERIARRLFESALDACGQLPDAIRKQLLKDIAELILDRIERTRPPEEPHAVRIIGIEVK
jgi:hypothetical protein